MNEFLQSTTNENYIFTELSEAYLIQAANLLISEWPRSLSQRCTSLRDFVVEDNTTEFQYKLPKSLILISKSDNQVVGHVSLVSIATTSDNKIKNLPFLQSLVIDKCMRGKGYGKRLVEFCENYVKEFDRRQGSDTIASDYTHCKELYLTTKDQHMFYEKISYVRTEAINFFTVKNSKNNLIMNRLMTSMQHVRPIENTREVETSESKPVFSLGVAEITGSAPSAPPPPLPPPMPEILIGQKNKLAANRDESIVPDWYKKCIL